MDQIASNKNHLGQDYYDNYKWRERRKILLLGRHLKTMFTTLGLRNLI